MSDDPPRRRIQLDVDEAAKQQAARNDPNAGPSPPTNIVGTPTIGRRGAAETQAARQAPAQRADLSLRSDEQLLAILHEELLVDSRIDRLPSEWYDKRSLRTDIGERARFRESLQLRPWNVRRHEQDLDDFGQPCIPSMRECLTLGCSEARNGRRYQGTEVCRGCIGVDDGWWFTGLRVQQLAERPNEPCGFVFSLDLGNDPRNRAVSWPDISRECHHIAWVLEGFYSYTRSDLAATFASIELNGVGLRYALTAGWLPPTHVGEPSFLVFPPDPIYVLFEHDHVEVRLEVPGNIHPFHFRPFGRVVEARR